MDECTLLYLYCQEFCLDLAHLERTNFLCGAKGNTQTCVAAGFLGVRGLRRVFFTMAPWSGFFCWWFNLVGKKITWSEKSNHGCMGYLYSLDSRQPLRECPPTVRCLWMNVLDHTYPPGCTDNVDCLRGGNAGIYRWAFFYAEVWAIDGFTIVAMFLIYLKVLRQEKVMEPYAFRSASLETTTSKKHRKRSTQFAYQAMLYSFWAATIGLCLSYLSNQLTLPMYGWDIFGQW